MYRGDDSIESANTPSNDSYRDMERDYSVYRCVVVQRKYTDDDENISKDSTVPTVMYDVQVIGGYKEGHVFVNCRLVQELGGDNNFSERVLKASTKPLNETGLSKTDGDIVYIAFIGGDTSAGIILGGGNQPQDSDQTGASSEQAIRKKSQYNGILTEIDKDGNYTLTRLGGTFNEQTSEFEPDKNGKNITIAYEDEKITRTFKSGLKITEDGKNDKFTVETSGGAIITINGKAGTIEIDSSNAKIIIDAAGKITLSGDNVDLGKSASDFVPLFTELMTAFNSHSHLVPVTSGSSAGAYPSQPPLAPMLSTVGSKTVKVQS